MPCLKRTCFFHSINFSIYQRDNQSITEFVSILGDRVARCEFISQYTCKADMFLGTRFIRGIKDYSTREHLLQSDIAEFEKIVSKAMALKAFRLDSSQIAEKQLSSSSTTLLDINMISELSKQRSRSKFQKNSSNGY